jgi:hypothetical protein
MNARFLSSLVAGALLVLAGPALAQEEYSFEGDQLLVSNLIGNITVSGHDGSRIIVRARAEGDDAGVLDFQVKEGGRAEFHVVYPLDDELRYSYPRRGNGRTQINVGSWRDDSSFLEDLYGDLSSRDKVEVSDGGRGLEAWADLEILVPNGVSTRIRLAVGELEARDVHAPVDLDTYSGPVRAENIVGDTRIDTGSGSVVARSITGDLHIDTGSGKVEVADVQGDDILIDTGSGSVTVDGASGRSLKVDTGSGSVRTSDIDAEDTLIDTGSGSVTLDLVRMGEGRHVIDTGSGSVTVRLPSDASCRISADTGSGGINLDVPNATLRRMSRDHVELDIGGGSGGSLEIDTGSGSITIETR